MALFDSCEFHRKVSYVHLNASTPIAASINRISLTSALRSYSIANSQCSFHDYVESADEFNAN